MKEKENKKITVVGHSVINHNVRHKLELNVSEYVLLQYLQTLLEDGMKPDEHNSMSMIGSDLQHVKLGIRFLADRGRVLLSSGPIEPRDILEYDIAIYPEWYKAHKEKGFEFALFWKPVPIGNDLVSWRQGSSKEGAKKKLVPVLKSMPIEQLIWNKLMYFYFKWETGSTDYLMMAETWLGPDKHYLTLYKLKPDTQTMFDSMINAEYGEGSQLDLRGLLSQGSVQTPVPQDDQDKRKRWDDD
jgi:hypothetical protein